MIITWYGQSCFKIQTKNLNDDVVITTDPFDKKLGLKTPSFETDIITVSHDHDDHNNTESLKGKPFIINTAGEYDVKGISIYGVESYHDKKKGEERGMNIIYRFEIEDVSISHLGDLGHELDDKQLDVLGGTDILLIPVGGKYTLDSKEATKIVAQIEPRIIIPMHYKIPELKVDIEGVEKFIKELGLKPTEETKFKISKKDRPQEDMELIILKKA